MRWLYICSIRSVAHRRTWVSLTGEWQWRNWDPAGIPSGCCLDACNPRASDWQLRRPMHVHVLNSTYFKTTCYLKIIFTSWYILRQNLLFASCPDSQNNLYLFTVVVYMLFCFLFQNYSFSRSADVDDGCQSLFPKVTKTTKIEFSDLRQQPWVYVDCQLVLQILQMCHCHGNKILWLSH